MNNRTISMSSIRQVNCNRLLAVSATSSECGVGQSSFVVADRCVDVIADASTYFEARARCRGRGQAADLVQLKTDADNAQAAAALRAFVNSPETAAPRAFWIGLTRSQWSWETPGELSPLATGYNRRTKQSCCRRVFVSRRLKTNSTQQASMDAGVNTSMSTSI